MRRSVASGPVLQLFNRAIRYGVVGVIGTFLHMGTLAVLVEQFHVDPVWSSVAGFCLALVTSYLLNFFWVFKSSRSHHVAAMRYVVVSLSGLGLSAGIMYAVVDVLNWWYGWGALGTVMLVPLSNFTLNYLWTFGARDANP